MRLSIVHQGQEPLHPNYNVEIGHALHLIIVLSLGSLVDELCPYKIPLNIFRKFHVVTLNFRLIQVVDKLYLNPRDDLDLPIFYVVDKGCLFC